MNRSEILKSLALAGKLTPKVSVMVRAMNTESDMWAYLQSLDAPDAVHAAADSPLVKSTEVLDRNEIQALADSHLSLLGFPTAPIQRLADNNIDLYNVVGEWRDLMSPDRGAAYDFGIQMGLHPRIAAILSQEGPAWIPLHKLISCDIEPFGLVQLDGKRSFLFRDSRNAV